MGKVGEPKFYEKIPLATYICDFGNIVAGSSRKKMIKITNVYSAPINFICD